MMLSFNHPFQTLLCLMECISQVDHEAPQAENTGIWSIRGHQNISHSR